MTWAANVLVLIGLLLIGSKKRVAFLFTFVGEFIWMLFGITKEMHDLAFICGVFSVIALINYYRWSKD